MLSLKHGLVYECRIVFNMVGCECYSLSSGKDAARDVNAWELVEGAVLAYHPEAMQAGGKISLVPCVETPLGIDALKNFRSSATWPSVRELCKIILLF